MAQARARKEKIISMEAERKKNEAKSDLEVEQMEKDKHSLSRADFLVDEQRDDVKRMNQFVRYLSHLRGLSEGLRTYLRVAHVTGQGTDLAGCMVYGVWCDTW